MRVAARGLAGIGGQDPHEAAEWTGPGMDWTAWFLAFKGVVLEGLEVAFIVGGIGLALHQTVRRIPRSLLQLIVGIPLSTFGTFWAIEGLGIDWPGGDAAIPVLLVLYAVTALTYITLERNRALGLRPAA